MKLKDRIRELMAETWDEVDAPIHPRLRWVPPFVWRLISWLMIAVFLVGAALLAGKRFLGWKKPLKLLNFSEKNRLKRVQPTPFFCTFVVLLKFNIMAQKISIERRGQECRYCEDCAHFDPKSEKEFGQGLDIEIKGICQLNGQAPSEPKWVELYGTCSSFVRRWKNKPDKHFFPSSFGVVGNLVSLRPQFNW